MTVVYMAHPVGDNPHANSLRSRRWLRWLHTERPEWVVIAPWLHDLEVLGHLDREAALIRCEAVAAVCHDVVLVGGEITEGMRREARACGVWEDWTHLGPEPPDDEMDAELGGLPVGA